MQSAFSKRLRQLRGDRSQAQFSKENGLIQQTYAAYEQGTREPDYEKLKQFSTRYAVTTDWLLGLNDTPPVAKSSDPPAITLTSKDVSNLLQAHRIAMEKIAELCHASKAGTPVDAGAGGGRATKTA